MRVIIDGRFVLDEADLHRRLAGAFGYGPAYRPDLESLRARLTAGDPRPLRLTLTNAATVRLALGDDAFRAFVAALETIEAGDAGKGWDERFVLTVLD
ncbi:barstar family protein [Paractinoplanes lichenicola]|uniref:Barstar family protein n=1 Tax=Paractinoplanes lichenicola TaxID=2802976 RepID=A0ABS1VNK5_9ACTN|nr:barstar family protein [Actinoplanes lichenicola]MBL7256328.1 barstar family protein [Actinoplanes lichenicola]